MSAAKMAKKPSKRVKIAKYYVDLVKTEDDEWKEATHKDDK